MAQLASAFNFIGRLGNVTAYKLKGSNKTILRTVGGPGKERIEKDPGFEKTRQNNSEFGGCGKSIKFLRKATFPMQQLADYNFSCQFLRHCWCFVYRSLTSLVTQHQQSDLFQLR